MKITRVETDLLRIPLPRPVSLPAAQDPRPATHADLLLVHVVTDGGSAGLGLTYTLGPGGAAVRAAVADVLSPVVVGEDPLRTEWLFARLLAALEGLGAGGAGARALCGLDSALWDFKGKVAGLPVHQLLGGYRTKLKAIASDTATPAVGAKQAARDTRLMLDRGAAGVVVEVGTQDPDVDIDRVRQLREAVPDGAWFEVAAAGRYDFGTALAVGRLCQEEFATDAFSDPLRPYDGDGLARLSGRLDVGLGVGALFDRADDFVRLLARGGVSAVRLDPARLGGLSVARKVAVAAELRGVATVPVRFPELGCHLGAGVLYGRVCEYVDWFAGVFGGGPQFADGQLVAPDGPGLGLTVREDVAAKYRV